jgi:aminoglycoside 3-N-acetyltransferase
LYDHDAKVLLLGVGHERNTSLHLAEYRSGVRPPAPQSGPVLVLGRREWLTWDDIDLDADSFPAMGADLERTGVVHLGQVGSATARLMPQRAAVDFATTWLREHVPRPAVENGHRRSTHG